jgi:hypothetical protein
MANKEDIQAELELIRSENGGMLRPEDVVEFARNEDTALHSQFEWDDTEAAHQYRLDQARRVIRLAITIVRTPDADRAVPLYVSLMPDRALAGGGYRPLIDVLTQREKREQLLRQALSEFERVRKKYDTLLELAPIFSAIDVVSREIEETDDEDTGTAA